MGGAPCREGGGSRLLLCPPRSPILPLCSSVPAHTHSLWVRPRQSGDLGGKGALSYVEGVVWLKWIFIAASFSPGAFVVFSRALVGHIAHCNSQDGQNLPLSPQALSPPHTDPARGQIHTLRQESPGRVSVKIAPGWLSPAGSTSVPWKTSLTISPNTSACFFLSNNLSPLTLDLPNVRQTLVFCVSQPPGDTHEALHLSP